MKNYKQRRPYNKNHNRHSKGGENKPVAVNNDKFAHIEAVQAKPLEVRVYHNNFDKAFRAFRALVQKERVLSLYKEKQYYEKPSDRRRRKKNEAYRKVQELCSTGHCSHAEHSTNKSRRKSTASRRQSHQTQPPTDNQT